MLTKFLLFATAAFFLLSVTAFDPASISRWIERAIGWEPLREVPATDEAPSLREAVAHINAADLEHHLRVLTADSSRVTGYAGATNAARYIEGEFRRLGLQVTSEFFPVSVPIDRGGRLRLIGSDEAIPIYGLWPNHVRSPSLPPGGVSGHLIDLGRGSLAEMDGKRLMGSIALMGFGSGNAHVEARALGAQAICCTTMAASRAARPRKNSSKCPSISLAFGWKRRTRKSCGSERTAATHRCILKRAWTGSRSKRAIYSPSSPAWPRTCRAASATKSSSGTSKSSSCKRTTTRSRSSPRWPRGPRTRPAWPRCSKSRVCSSPKEPATPYSF